MKITVPVSDLHDLGKLERKHRAKFIQATIDGDTAVVEMSPVADLAFYVNVRNCCGTIVLCAETGNQFLDDLYEYDEALADALIIQVVEGDYDAGINMSGQYWPLTAKSVKLFQKLMQSARPKPAK